MTSSLLEHFDVTLFNNLSYDERILDWLSLLKQPICEGKAVCPNRIHSIPQSSFLLQKTGISNKVELDENLDIIGDLRELPTLMEFVGFPFNHKKKPARTAANDPAKTKEFPKRLDLLSNSTMQELCLFLEVDYYLFSFEPPPACLVDSLLEDKFIDKGL